MSQLTRIGVLAHPKRQASAPLAEQIAQRLSQRGLQSWFYTQWEAEEVAKDVASAELVIAIGGDGAMLQASRVCAPYQVPVLGINMGRLGFLTEISEVEQWEAKLDQLLAGDYWIEKRMMLTACVIQGREVVAQGDALNEVLIGGTVVGHMVQIDTYIDKSWATTYNADGLIIATPTGSTGYALSVGAPILPPQLTNILLVPVAPHLSMDRPIVLSEGATVDVRVAEANRDHLMLTLDGSVITELDSSHRVQITASQNTSRFVRLRERNYFYRSLLDRLEPRVSREPPSYTLEEDSS